MSDHGDEPGPTYQRLEQRRVVIFMVVLAVAVIFLAAIVLF